MKKIRTGIFETNSSSVHCICIANNNIKAVSQSSLNCLTGEYGWEDKTYYSALDKADYLCTMIALYSDDSKRDLNRLKNILKKYNVEFSCRQTEDSYIDHGYAWGDTLETLLGNEELLINFLFNPSSFVKTGNDNDYEQHMVYDSPDVEYAEAQGFTVFTKYN